VSTGQEKLASVPAGGAVAASAPAGGAPAAEAKQGMWWIIYLY
jgi:hypothetical protein